MRQPIVTLISDFGSTDYYVPALKGNILKCLDSVQIVDVTHDIIPHDIVQAAFILKNFYKSYPPGTVHIIYVKNHEPEQNLIFTKYQGQYFVAPNNGLFSLVFQEPLEYYRLKKNAYMPFKELGELIKAFQRDDSFEEIAEKEENVLARIGIHPIITKDQIRASIIHVDRYGNLVVNVDHKTFEATREGRRFKIYFKRLDPIVKISEFYSDGQAGEPIALFNSSGNMVISVCMGNAEEDLNIKKEETIQIVFD